MEFENAYDTDDESKYGPIDQHILKSMRAEKKLMPPWVREEDLTHVPPVPPTKINKRAYQR